MGKSSSLIYHYRNCRVKSIPLETLYTSLELADIPKENLQYSVIRTYSAEEERRNILNEGREIHKDRLMKIKEGIPSLTSLYDGCALNVERWFLVYQKLIDFGTRQFQSLKFNENKIELHYTCYSKGKKKAFTQYLPKKIEVNEEFQYFFGLWCGDRLGKGRMGVANKDKLINFFTRDYLMKLYQKDVEFVLMYNEGIPLPKIDYATQVVCNSAKTNIKGYCINVGIKNSILFQFFDYLKQNLDEFLSSLPSRNFFFAGLFDAEGNIFLEDVCVRWACIEKKMLSILIKHFKEEGIFKRYDGYSVVSYNLTYFEDKTLFPPCKLPPECLGYELHLRDRR